MPGAELQWLWVRTGDASPSPASGHTIALAGAFPFGLGTGLRLDLVRPPDAARAPYHDPYAWLTWGLSLGGDTGAFGLGINHIYADDPDAGGLTTVTLGLTARPTPGFALAAVAHDVNAPRSDSGAYIDRRYTLATAIRPLGTRQLQLGIEADYYSDVARSPAHEEAWVPRLVLGVDVPYVGRVRGDVTVYDLGESSREYRATAVLDISAAYATATGGAIWGSALGGSDGAGFIAGVAFRTWREPGLPLPGYAVKIRIEKTPDNREHVALLRRLWELSLDSEIKAIVFLLKTSPASSLAHSDEFDDAVRLLQARGKKVVCHLEDAGGRSLHACASADRIVVNPAGGIRFAGMSVDRTYYAGLMQKLGIRAQFVRIGEHKSAPEQFTNTGPSDTARSDYLENLQQSNAELLAALARGRRVPFDQMRRSIESGPFTAAEALSHKLVDGYAFDDELRTVVSETVGRPINLHDEAMEVVKEPFGQRRSVALVYVDGMMVDGRSQSIPFLDVQLAGSYTIAEALKDARESPWISAVVLRIESPGGSSMAADVMWREVQLTVREKPVIVSMGGVAASGGYYIAVPARTIFASPYTATGSIGIYYGKADIAQLMQKIGVNVSVLKTAPRADAESIYRPFTPEEVQVLGAKVKQFYDVFIDRVAKGRHMQAQEVDAVARGRVWMGRAAQRHGLVDHIGGLRQALAEARRLGDLPDDCPIVELPPPEFSLLRVASSLANTEHDTAAELLQLALPRQVRDTLRSASPFLVFEPDKPLAVSEMLEPL